MCRKNPVLLDSLKTGSVSGPCYRWGFLSSYQASNPGANPVFWAGGPERSGVGSWPSACEGTDKGIDKGKLGTLKVLPTAPSIPSRPPGSGLPTGQGRGLSWHLLLSLKAVGGGGVARAWRGNGADFPKALKAQKEGRAGLTCLRIPPQATQPPLSESLFFFTPVSGGSRLFFNSFELRALSRTREGSRGHWGTVNTPSDHKSQTLQALQ